MSDIICEFCQNTFSSKGNLKIHQIRAIYCLERRGESIELGEECQYCQINLSGKSAKRRHERICHFKEMSIRHDVQIAALSEELDTVDCEVRSSELEKKRMKSSYKCKIRKMKIKIRAQRQEYGDRLASKEAQIAKLDVRMASKEVQIAELEDELHSFREDSIKLREKVAHGEGGLECMSKVYDDLSAVATLPRKVTTTTNYIHPKLASISIATIDPFTVETFQKRVKDGEYTYDMFQHSPLGGLVEFITSSTVLRDEDDAIIERSYACTDPARHKCHRLVQSREWEMDNGAQFINQILDQLREIVKECHSVNVEACRTADSDFRRKWHRKMIDQTEDIYQGVCFPGSRERRVLFTKLRGEISTLATV